MTEDIFEAKIGDSVFIRMTKDSISVEMFEMLLPMLRNEFKKWKEVKR